jgi:prolyl-tRNA synthetase
MRQSELFTQTAKNAPADATTVNHQLLVRGGFVDQLMAGGFSYLPLGLRVLRKIESIVREEMNFIGGQEILMPVLHPSSIWKTTGAWDKVEVLFKIKSRTGNEYALGYSEEEVVTPLVMQFVQSYRDLPKSVYQIHWKYRDELRAKSGILRGREFFMKDMYSFHTTQTDFEKFYETVKKSYLKIFERLGLTAKVTEASGGSFSEKISYEFEVLTDAGEDEILFCEECDFCVNLEIAQVKLGEKCPRCGKGVLKQATASEVGNVFDLGQKYPKDFNLTYVDKDNKAQFPYVGCYGLGISRVMGVIVEKFNDEKGIVWPETVAPFAVHLLALGDDEKVKRGADELYEKLVKKGVEVLYDDRQESAGGKLADSDLIGIPQRWIVSEKTLREEAIEVKNRNQESARLIKISSI